MSQGICFHMLNLYPKSVLRQQHEEPVKSIFKHCEESRIYKVQQVLVEMSATHIFEL